MILINALSALDGGGQTYLLNLLKYVQPNDKNKIIILCHLKNRELFEGYGVRIITSHLASKSIIRRILFESIALKWLLKKENINVLYSLSGLLPRWSFPGLKKVTVFQNLLPFSPSESARYPLGYTWLRHHLLKNQQSQSFKRSDLLIFISKYAKKVIIDDYRLPIKRSVVIYHGLDESFLNPVKLTPTIELPDDYILYVSKLHPYKAQVEVLKAWKYFTEKRKTKEKLILVGSQYPSYAKKVFNIIRDLELENSVSVFDNLPHETLPSIYHNAKINLFASSCENCPNILLEALAAGKPVFSSNYQPMPEIADSAVVYFDPYDFASLGKLLLQYIDDEIAMKELGIRALAKAKEYSWKKTAKQTWEELLNLEA